MVLPVQRSRGRISSRSPCRRVHASTEHPCLYGRKNDGSAQAAFPCQPSIPSNVKKRPLLIRTAPHKNSCLKSLYRKLAFRKKLTINMLKKAWPQEPGRLGAAAAGGGRIGKLEPCSSSSSSGQCGSCAQSASGQSFPQNNIDSRDAGPGCSGGSRASAPYRPGPRLDAVENKTGLVLAGHDAGHAR